VSDIELSRCIGVNFGFPKSFGALRGVGKRSPGTFRRKSEPALASHATSGFPFAQRNGFVIVALKYPVQPSRQFRQGVPEHGRAEWSVQSASIKRSTLVRLHGEMEFLEAAIERCRDGIPA
jgi:hypothetical protein